MAGKLSSARRPEPDFQVSAPNLEGSDVVSRARWAVRAAGGNKSVASISGIPVSTLNELLKGREMRLSHITAIAQACGVTASWLAFGEGQPFVANETQQFLVSEYRLVDVQPTDQASPPAVQPVAKQADGYIPVPRYNIEASAGGGAIINSEQIVEYLAFSPEFLHKEIHRPAESLVLITARGNSMEPTIRHGDLLLVDISDRSVSTSEIHVIRIEDELLVKRVERRIDGSLLIHSDNPRYPTQEIPKSARKDLNIIGKVIWQGGPVRS